jgi:hypothetical protein
VSLRTGGFDLVEVKDDVITEACHFVEVVPALELQLYPSDPGDMVVEGGKKSRVDQQFPLLIRMVMDPQC